MPGLVLMPMVVTAASHFSWSNQSRILISNIPFLINYFSSRSFCSLLFIILPHRKSGSPLRRTANPLFFSCPIDGDTPGYAGGKKENNNKMILMGHMSRLIRRQVHSIHNILHTSVSTTTSEHASAESILTKKHEE